MALKWQESLVLIRMNFISLLEMKTEVMSSITSV